MASKIEEIYEFVLPEMKAQGIEDTTIHRIWFLEGLRDGWKEDVEDDNPDKVFYMVAINSEIFRLNLERLFPSIKS